MAENSNSLLEFGDSNSGRRTQFLIGRSPKFGKLGSAQMSLGLAGDLAHINFDRRYLHAANGGSTEPSFPLFPSKLSSASNYRIPKQIVAREERLAPPLNHYALPHIKAASERRLLTKSGAAFWRQRSGSINGQ